MLRGPRPLRDFNPALEDSMTKMIATLGVILLAGLAMLLALAATKPDTFRVQRTATIKAPPEKIFALVDDFRRWNSWSPYETMDPAMKRTLSGAVSGKGAVYEWEGNSKVGQGRMEIADTSAPSKVMIKLDFLKPFEAHNTAEFTLEPNGAFTNVTWAMHGPSPYLAKVMGIFFDMDHMIGKDFETGLANLKALTEE
jgi:carbon monoxide dehydrogenase subunit G